MPTTPEGSPPISARNARAAGDRDAGPAANGTAVRPPAWRTAVVVVISCALVAAIVAGAGTDRVVQVFIDTGWLGAAHILALYTLAQFLRAVRFTLCISGPRPPLPRMFAIVCMHQFFNHVMPARLGELSFPFLASRYASVPVPAATRLLIVIRIYEFVILGLLFIGAASFLLLRADAGFLAGSILGCAALLVLAILFLSFGMQAVLRAVRSVLARIAIARWRRSALRPRVLAGIESVEAEFLRPRPAGETLAAIVFSVLIWVVLFRINYIALGYAGIDVSFFDTIVGSTFANASHVLPVNTVGSFGSLEAGWTFGFVLLGVPARAALASGFALHAIGVAFLSTTATLSWIALRRTSRRPTSAGPAP